MPISVNLSCQPAKSVRHPQVRQGLKPLSNSESPLKED